MHKRPRAGEVEAARSRETTEPQLTMTTKNLRQGQSLQPHSFYDESKDGSKWGFDYDLSERRKRVSTAGCPYPLSSSSSLARP
jgi:hypothetical protein